MLLMMTTRSRYRAFEMLNTAGDQRLNVTLSGQQPVFGDGGQATPITVFATTDSGAAVSGARGLQLFASNFWSVESRRHRRHRRLSLSLSLSLSLCLSLSLSLS
eukprot:COSAG01_NODE_13314_length_1603_cov_1.805186_3_plen_103_part_01